MTGAANLSLFGERRLIELRLAGPIDTTAARSLTSSPSVRRPIRCCW